MECDPAVFAAIASELASDVEPPRSPGFTVEEDSSLENFLRAQGLDFDSLMLKSEDQPDFSEKVSEVRQVYEDRIARLEMQIEEDCEAALNYLVEQSKSRPVSNLELENVTAQFDSKMAEMKRAIRMQCFESLSALAKVGAAKPKSRRALDKGVTEVLNQWFFSHINDPVSACPCTYRFLPSVSQLNVDCDLIKL